MLIMYTLGAAQASLACQGCLIEHGLTIYYRIVLFDYPLVVTTKAPRLDFNHLCTYWLDFRIFSKILKKEKCEE